MNVEEIIKRAIELVEEDKLDEAEKLYEDTLKVYECPEIWNNLGNVYKRKGLLSKAIQAYEKALRIDPGFKIARANLGIAYMDIGRYAEAAMILEKVLESGFVSDEIYLALAISYEKSGRIADFVKVYRKLKHPDKDEILRSYGVEPPSG